MINVAAEYLGWSNADVTNQVDAIGERLAEVLDVAAAEGLASNVAADRLARDMILCRTAQRDGTKQET